MKERSKLSPDPEDVLNNQVEALEEAKQLLTSEVISLRQKIVQLEADHVPGGKVLERANELATENVGLKAAVDDLTGENATLKERLEALRRDLRDVESDLEQLHAAWLHLLEGIEDLQYLQRI